jgi:YfiR/HmsC-like
MAERGGLVHFIVKGSTRGENNRQTVAARREVFVLVLLVFSIATPGSKTLAQTKDPTEYEIKAAFLLNFAKFVEWPAEAFANDVAPISLCVVRYDPFGSALDDTIRGKLINNRQLLARRINELPELKACQMVFVSEREEKRLSEILTSVKGSNALVVGESEDFAERGGSVQFYLENSRLRFAVNVDAVQRARLTVSSKLLTLAKIVHDPIHPKGE